MNTESQNDATGLPAHSTIPAVSFTHQRSAAEEPKLAYP